MWACVQTLVGTPSRTDIKPNILSYIDDKRFFNGTNFGLLMKRVQIALLAVLWPRRALGGCETTTNPESLAQNDPYEPTNRKIFALNNDLDKHVARPVAVFYNHAVPGIARDRFHNVLTNLDEPVVFANDVLQGEPKRAIQTVGRITFNTTLGIGGMFDIATKMGIPPHTEDFGQTLGVWGSGEGPYWVLPFAGPSQSARRWPACVGDIFAGSVHLDHLQQLDAWLTRSAPASASSTCAPATWTRWTRSSAPRSTSTPPRAASTASTATPKSATARRIHGATCRICKPPHHGRA